VHLLVKVLIVTMYTVYHKIHKYCRSIHKFVIYIALSFTYF